MTEENQPVGLVIPAAFQGVALQAVASGIQSAMLDVATQLGTSVPALVQHCLELVHDQSVYAQHPRACRRILDRVQAGREARDGACVTGEG